MQTSGSLPDPRRWWALVVTLTATFMAILDTFVVNVAIPSIQRNLQSTFAQVELVIAGYTLVYAVLMVTGGRLGDIFTRKRMFQLGMLGFTLTSLLCGIAPNTNVLIAVRVLQGMAAAMMTPQVVALIQLTFTERERGVALGFYGATVGIASITGQIVGGLLITSDVFGLGWRSVFLVNILIGILALIATVPLLPDLTTDRSHRLDLGGVGILTLGLGLLVYPLVEGHDVGWPLWTFVCMILAVPVLVFFVWYEYHLMKSGGSPLVPLVLFQHKSFNLGILTALAYYSGNGALFFTLALYLQLGLGFTPLAAGLTFLPIGIGFFLSSLLAPRAVPFLGAWVLRLGAIIMGLGEIWTLLALQQVGLIATAANLLLPLFVVGFGEGVIAAPLMNVVLAGVGKENTGAASGILTTMIQISQAMGVAVVGVVFFSVLGTVVPAHVAQAAHAYGQAFVAALVSITILALATLVCCSLLPSPKKTRQKEVRTEQEKSIAVKI